MAVTLIVGLQWGDEGKGKITDLLAGEMDYVVRYQGGHNAGHTVMIGDETFALQLIPSGVFYPHIVPVIANGVVVDPKVLLEEIDALETRGISTKNLLISGNAHLIMPYHHELDRVTERYLGKNKLGTTKRGIGPAYSDKASRVGLRVQDMADEKIFKQKLEVVLKEKNAILTKVYNRLALDFDSIYHQYIKVYAPRIIPLMANTVELLHNAVKENKNILLEGAQATYLDLDHGTYPYVTSSNPTAGGALTGTGLGPRDLTKIIGVAKAYVTRVGAGPFPTEIEGDLAELLTQRGREFGTNTGRRRRVGWLDLVMLKHAIELNSVDEVALTKLDVLDVLEFINVCVGYEIDGKAVSHVPYHQSELHRAKPIYQEFSGWRCDLSGVTKLEEFPKATKIFVDFLEQYLGVPVCLAGVGPRRSQIIDLAS